MLPRFVQGFHPTRQPWITRQSYSHEIVAAMTYPVAGALMEGGVIGVLAAKAFSMPPVLFALIPAAPMFANLTSFFWARLARGKHKVPFIVGLQIAALTCIGLIAALPLSQLGALLLVVLVVTTRCLLAGIVTIRSTVWRQNYPRAVRAKVTSRFTVIGTCLMATVPMLGYALLDRNPEAFRLIYPASVLVAMIGVAAYGRIRLRGERDLLSYEAATARRVPEATASVAPEGAGAPRAPAAPRATVWSVLKHDRLYRRYMSSQFIFGGGNMMAEVVLIYAIAEMTEGMNHAYFLSIVLTTALPMILAMLAVQAWAKYLDRVHISTFRIRQSAFLLGHQLCAWLALMMAAPATALALIAAGRILVGLSKGGGMLAWNLGHNDFADHRLVPLYMGIHVTLTGVRGATFPVLGMLLYAGWDARTLPGLGLTLPGFAGIGGHVFAVTVACTLAGVAGFAVLSRHLNQQGRAAPEPGREPAKVAA